MTNENPCEFALYMRCKKKDLKWYKKFLNIITFNKDKNYEWKLVEKAMKGVKYD